MGRMPRGTYLWPGLPQLWKEGSWYALGLAIGFAALVNLAIAATLIWSELAPPGVRSLVWGAVGAVWVASVIGAYRWDRRQAAWYGSGPVRDAFAAAVDHYLKGNWFEAERILDGLVAENPRDVDAGLMRAALFRHTGRHEEAAAELERIQRFESCRKWELEIRRERELLKQARSENAEPSTKTTAGGPTEPTQPIADAA